jgi:hypothetical protein
VADAVTSLLHAHGKRLGVGVSARLPSRGVAARRCPCGDRAGLDGECAQCRAKRLARERGAGRPLDASTRAHLERRFRRNLGGVRVHTGPEVAASARALDAAAYTLGRDVVFGAGRYAPETRPGRRLLAHELAHVIQQGREGGAPQRSTEREAGRAGALAASAEGGPVPVLLGARGVQRQPLTPAGELEPLQQQPAPDAQDTAAIDGLTTKQLGTAPECP